MKTVEILKDLVSFETVSKQNNLSMIGYIDNYLKKFSSQSELIMGNKNQANYYARIGPKTNDGIMFSGHTDVVPIDGQNWKTKPFQAKLIKNKVYGRGTCDMKGFIAVVLSILPRININNLRKPIHLMFSYDEEIGCVGIQKAVPFIKKMSHKPKFCVVGEPTEMKLISQHKGKKNFLVSFHGIASHSSLKEEGVNAIDFAAEFVVYLSKVQDELKLKKFTDECFNPPYTTVNVGQIRGGIALNIVPSECIVEFELRDLPTIDINLFVKKIESFLTTIELRMKKLNKSAYIKFEKNNSFLGLNTDDNCEIIEKSLNALGSNKLGTVSFGTEAGIFDKLGIQTIVCGPGSIKQAHKPDEFVTIQQLKKCEKFLTKMIKNLY